MKSKDGKYMVLNPADQTPIIDVAWNKSLGEEIQKRIVLYIETFLKSEEITQIFEKIKIGTIEYYTEVSNYLSKMEAKWTDVQKRNEKFYKASLTFMSLLDKPIFLVSITVVAVLIFLAFFPILIPALAILFRSAKKMELKREYINKVYDTHMLSIRNQIHKHLTESCGNALKILSDKIFKEALPNQIQHIEIMIQNLQQSREKILANSKCYKELADKVEAMKMSLLKL